MRVGVLAEPPAPRRALRPSRVVLAVLISLVLGGFAARDRLEHHHISRDLGFGRAIVRKTATGLDELWAPSPVTITIDPTLARATSAAGRPIMDAFGAWTASGAQLPPLSFDMATTTGPAERDGVNRMIFGPITIPGYEQALAITISYPDDSTGEIIEADTIFNSAYRWAALKESDDEKECGSRYDLQNVATHEAGHFFGLGEDYQETTTTMYVSSEQCQTSKRVLSASDISVVSGLYAQSAALSSQTGCGGGRVQ